MSILQPSYQMPTGDEHGPTKEIGYSTIYPMQWSIWSSDQDEDVPELRWPMSIRTYSRMRSDTQLSALLLAVNLPIQRRRWIIDPNNARDEVVFDVASSLGLPIKGSDDPPPRSFGFNHNDHLRHSLLALVYGFMFFEQVGFANPVHELRWTLQKLAPRMPQSISYVDVAPNGDLLGIRQWPRMGEPMGGLPISEQVLAPYIWQREGANWLGRSMLRECYKNWVIKDRMIRVDAIKNERFGIGIPQATAPQGASREVIQRYAAMAQASRADATSGVGLPNGASIGVEGIRGTLPDTLATIHYHDEAMARRFLAMFVELGTTQTGSRALGEAFVDFFTMSIEAISTWHASTTNQYVISDMVDWNYGPEETVPLLTWDEDPESRMDAADLVQLIDAGVIVVDAELRSWITDRWGLPDPGPGTPDPGTPDPPGPSSSTAGVPATNPNEPAQPATGTPAGATRRHRQRRRSAAASSQTVNDARIGHREPNEHEVRAAANFSQIQAEWADATKTLVDKFKKDVRSKQVDELKTAVKAAATSGNIKDLASVSATTTGNTVISEAMTKMMEQAVTTAKAEAAAQGIDMATIDVADLTTQMGSTAEVVAELLARALSTSAATQALNRYGVTNLAPDEVANGVEDHLNQLTDAYLYDQLGGALTQAQNAGRLQVMGQAPGTYYASELLDENTCEACSAEDGTAFTTIDAAAASYPTGGYSECYGGPRCRGTIVAVYDEGNTQEGT